MIGPKWVKKLRLPLTMGQWLHATPRESRVRRVRSNVTLPALQCKQATIWANGYGVLMHSPLISYLNTKYVPNMATLVRSAITCSRASEQSDVGTGAIATRDIKNPKVLVA